MGHFGRAAHQPGLAAGSSSPLILAYLGQGALLLRRPGQRRHPFFLLVPGCVLIPMVILGAAATVIASQALISGAYSLTQQAVQLGYLPRLRIAYTRKRQIGQIYVPWINWLLLVAVLTLVVSSRAQPRWPTPTAWP